MKKITSLIFLLAISLAGFSQSLSNLPSKLGTYTAFKDNPLSITINMPVGYTIPTPVVSEIWASGLKTSFAPITSISGQVITITMPAVQVTRLPAISDLYIKFNGTYLLGATIKPSSTTGTPSSTPYNVTLPSVGAVSINLIGDAAAAAQYAARAKVLKDSVNQNQWTGKYFVWCGTSIPWNFAPNSYPEQVARMLGATVYNTSISGSKIIFNGSSAGMSGTYTQNAPYGQNNSYQATILYYMTLPTNAASLVVIDHLANDAPFLPANLGDISSTDKSTFYGAYNFVIDQIQATNPLCKIVLVTSENKSPYGVASAAHDAGNDAIRKIAKKRALSLLDFAENDGINEYTAVAGRATSDGLHPTQAWTNKLAQIAYRFLLTVN